MFFSGTYRKILKKYNMLKASDIFKQKSYVLYYKIRHRMAPDTICDLISFSNTNLHSRQLRSSNSRILDIYHAHSRSGENCVRFFLPRLINNSNEMIIRSVETKSLSSYKYFIKKYLLSFYSQDECPYNFVNCYSCRLRGQYFTGQIPS